MWKYFPHVYKLAQGCQNISFSGKIILNGSLVPCWCGGETQNYCFKEIDNTEITNSKDNKAHILSLNHLPFALSKGLTFKRSFYSGKLTVINLSDAKIILCYVDCK